MDFSATVTFDFPTLNALAHHIVDELSGGIQTLAISPGRQPYEMSQHHSSQTSDIVGVSCRFPGQTSGTYFAEDL